MKAKDILKLIASILACQFAGFLGSLFTTPAIPTWYATLKKPFFNPPNYIFGPVWTSLYLLMGISLFLFWRRSDSPGYRTALIFFFVQLILNILWPIAFFGLRSPLSGLVVILLLWIAILLTIWRFLKTSRMGGLLLLPYLVWVSFAVLLNAALWRLNFSI
jgi:translocator protein